MLLVLSNGVGFPFLVFSPLLGVIDFAPSAQCGCWCLQNKFYVTTLLTALMQTN
uniref:Uncharacterized protein n=1 Tax=Rhizophora mucronata TaxID=61149 RepID=A0A2P2KU87_RHIMU